MTAPGLRLDWEQRHQVRSFREDLCEAGAPVEEYGRFQQHLVLLEDAGRVGAYIKAITQIPPGGVVVDVGSGTGVLSILALKAGFERAVMIEPSRKMCAYAHHVAELNGVSDRVTILNSTLEDIDVDTLPAAIDLIVSETLSSLLFGFGSWDAMPSLVPRLTARGQMIPLRGQLFGALSETELATRGAVTDGLALLKSAGVALDLFQSTFRSGGNIYNKAVVARQLVDGQLQPFQIADFDFERKSPVSMPVCRTPISASRLATGLVTYWTVSLTGGDLPVTIDSRDPRVTSWYPFYVPFREPVRLQAGQEFEIRLALSRMDRPYKYAFQFFSGVRELTNVLYW